MNVKNVQEAGARSSKLGVGSGAGDMCPGAEAQWRLRSPSAVAALWRDKKSERSGAICLEAKGGTKVTIIYDNSTHLHSREKGRGACVGLWHARGSGSREERRRRTEV